MVPISQLMPGGQKGATIDRTTNTHTYDGNSNRIAVTTAGVTTTEVWDTNNALPMLVAERNGAGAVLRRYGYGPGGAPLRFDDVAAGKSGFYVTDGLGSVCKENGLVVVRRRW